MYSDEQRTCSYLISGPLGEPCYRVYLISIRVRPSVNEAVSGGYFSHRSFIGAAGIAGILCVTVPGME